MEQQQPPIEGLIASAQDLEAWDRLSAAERTLTPGLRGVLAETAITGVIRYPWPLLRPLLVHLVQEQLTAYEAAEHVEIGPARPITDSGDSVASLVQRFTRLLYGFDAPPWTLQRLCEVLLAPEKQYKRLHKLALALEKLLLVTGEVGCSADPGPPPALAQLSRVNEAPPAPVPAAGSNATARQGEPHASGLVAAALQIRQPPGASDGSGPQEAASSAAAGAAAPAAAEAAAAGADTPAPAPAAPAADAMDVDASAGAGASSGAPSAAPDAASALDAAAAGAAGGAAGAAAPTPAAAAAAAAADGAAAAEHDAVMSEAGAAAEPQQ